MKLVALWQRTSTNSLLFGKARKVEWLRTDHLFPLLSFSSHVVRPHDVLTKTEGFWALLELRVVFPLLLALRL